MPKGCNLIDPLGMLELFVQQQRLMLAAAETIFRRFAIASAGRLTHVEMVGMLAEKPTAFATGFERAAVAAARGRTPVAVMTEFYEPMTRKASSNAKRLRR